MNKKEKENIALLYDYRIVEWDPLEIEDPYGYVIYRKGAEAILNRLLTQHWKEMDQYKEVEVPATDKELEDVRAFHQKFGFIDSGRIPVMVTKRKLRERAECLQEELDEFKMAIESQDFAEQADALIDLVYFAKGTAVIMGLPWEKLWDDVQRANISKERGITKRGHAFDVVKPEGWQAPNGLRILTEAGYDRRYFESHGVINENLCTDDMKRVYFGNVSSNPAEIKLVRFTANYEITPDAEGSN
jgi:predicted HAD superfamily Cof-like phosphohydrolase